MPIQLTASTATIITDIVRKMKSLGKKQETTPSTKGSPVPLPSPLLLIQELL
jgi:hypothetical protein